MDNKLIPTNGKWYKIKKFFKNIFFKEKSYNANKMAINENGQTNNAFVYDNNLRNRFEKEKQKEDLAEKLLLGEIGTSELDDIEVNEMTEYFTKDIQNIDNELARIKNHILFMSQELK